jgi:hypothetical protein
LFGAVSAVDSFRPIWITEKTSDQAQDGSDYCLVDLFKSLDAQDAATCKCRDTLAGPRASVSRKMVLGCQQSPDMGRYFAAADVSAE